MVFVKGSSELASLPFELVPKRICVAWIYLRKYRCQSRHDSSSGSGCTVLVAEYRQCDNGTWETKKKKLVDTGSTVRSGLTPDRRGWGRKRRIGRLPWPPRCWLQWSSNFELVTSRCTLRGETTGKCPVATTPSGTRRKSSRTMNIQSFVSLALLRRWCCRCSALLSSLALLWPYFSTLRNENSSVESREVQRAGSEGHDNTNFPRRLSKT